MTPPTLRERFREDLWSGSLPVLLTATWLAMVIGLGTATVLYEFGPGFLLLIVIGVLVPHVHEKYWPQDRPWQRDVGWTVAASLVATVLYWAAYLLMDLVVGETVAAVVAFVLTILAGGAIIALLRVEES